MVPNDFIKMRETSKEIEIDGRIFIIEKFNPLEGNYILLQAISFVLPFGIGEKLAGRIPFVSAKDAKLMSKQEFYQFQIDILKSVYEKLENGNRTPVVREGGSFGITNPDMSLLIKLIVSSLVFNFKDFFGEEPSEELHQMI